MLNKFLESLYHKIFINIVINRTTTDVYVEECSKKDVISSAQHSFDTTKLNEQMRDVISTYTKESPYYYISILDSSKEQGAVPTCSKNIFSRYCNIDDVEHKCNDNKWSYYTSNSNLYGIEKNYKDIGIDMFFSPFSILSNFFEDKIDSHLAMYVLVQEDSISFSVFEESKLIYGDYIDMQMPLIDEDILLSDDIEDLDLELDDGINLDELDVDEEIEDIDDLEDFADIEDLDAIEDIDEFAKTEDIEEELYEAAEETPEVDEDSFNEDYERFSFIQTSLGHFYDDDKYESKFIENIYIADSVGVSSELKRYLEEEMFLNVYIRHLELSVEVAKLAKMEVAL